MRPPTPDSGPGLRGAAARDNLTPIPWDPKMGSKNGPPWLWKPNMARTIRVQKMDPFSGSAIYVFFRTRVRKLCNPWPPPQEDTRADYFVEFMSPRHGWPQLQAVSRGRREPSQHTNTKTMMSGTQTFVRRGPPWRYRESTRALVPIPEPPASYGRPGHD